MNHWLHKIPHVRLPSDSLSQERFFPVLKATHLIFAERHRYSNLRIYEFGKVTTSDRDYAFHCKLPIPYFKINIRIDYFGFFTLKEGGVEERQLKLTLFSKEGSGVKNRKKYLTIFIGDYW